MCLALSYDSDLRCAAPKARVVPVRGGGARSTYVFVVLVLHKRERVHTVAKQLPNQARLA